MPYGGVFESSAILSGSKTSLKIFLGSKGFESSAILSGSKTRDLVVRSISRFESSAILSGSKTRCSSRSPDA